LSELPKDNITIKLKRDRPPCSFDKQELRAFLQILQERLDSAADLEITRFEQRQQSPEEFEENKNILRQGYKLRPTITGEDGRDLYGLVEDIFDSPNFPGIVKSVYINSAIHLKANYNFIVRNSVEVFIDFSKPSIFDFQIMPGHRTPNETNFKVQGADATWVNGLFYEMQRFIDDHRSIVPWLHEHSIYDIFVWFFGCPIGFWLCYKTSPFIIEGGGAIQFLRAAIYLYIFLMALVGLRALFHYSRWVFPLSEYRHYRSKIFKHRAFLAAISIGLIVAVIYDLIKATFSS
jgi:hypothetical protein